MSKHRSGCQSDMELTKRTLIRHLLVAALLVSMLPIALGTQGITARALLQWARLHLGFHLSLLATALVSGLLAETLVRRHRIRLFFVGVLARSRPRAAFRDFRRERGGRGLRLLLLWGGCSRCVAYWVGGLSVTALSGFYWGSRVPVLVYFGLLGAALSAATATAAYLHYRLAISQSES